MDTNNTSFTPAPDTMKIDEKALKNNAGIAVKEMCIEVVDVMSKENFAQSPEPIDYGAATPPPA